ncbi:MAG: ATP citrate lyase citrate-binding domain-containing protein [Candidatus Micrarchaeota archaeon]|nr:ATP citrate lyase citrate-binding domain-containing protein [Candidatus Micrarchaeota archaeon]
MPRRKIREHDAKKMLAKNLHSYGYPLALDVSLVDEKTDMDKLAKEKPWLKTKKLVVKPDQLIGKKGKNNLILLKAGFDEAKKFIKENMGKTIDVSGVKGALTHFIIEPFVEHDNEYFLAILSQREQDMILFSEKGGVDVEDHWDDVIQIPIPIDANREKIDIGNKLKGISGEQKEKLVLFVRALYNYYVDFGCTYLEMNPLTFDKNDEIVPLGLVCEVDDCEHFKCESKWNGLEFPQPFGRKMYPEEKFVMELDDKTGASLKLTILNPDGKIWILVAGGGASVIYADTVVDLGYGKELGNYGEYSGDPNEEETYQYAKTVIDLATRNPTQLSQDDNVQLTTEKVVNAHYFPQKIIVPIVRKHPNNREHETGNRILLIGGGVANFTNVANTFKGIIRALREAKEKLHKNKMQIYVRRGGPNFEEGLNMMKKLGNEIEIPIEVYGPEANMTKIVDLAIKKLNGGTNAK